MPDRSECRDIVRQLWPFLDEALSDEWRVRVEAHLAACTDCRSHYDFERAFLEVLRSSGEDNDEFAPLRMKVLAALTAEGMGSP